MPAIYNKMDHQKSDMDRLFVKGNKEEEACYQLRQYTKQR
jgi:hypothetical protein